MDRQSLLEQKRQRLQELKLRRLQGSTSPSKSIDDLIHNLQQPKGKPIDVAVQVDIVPTATLDIPAVATPQNIDTHGKEIQVATYDKGIQVEPIEPIDTYIPSSDLPLIADPAPAPRPHPDSPEHEPEKLNPDLVDSLKRLNRALALDADLPSLFADFTKVTISGDTNRNQTRHTVEQMLPPISGRYVTDIDTSSDFIVVAYSAYNHDLKFLESAANRIRYAPGLAIIYSIRATKPFPEFFLEASTPISKIKFEPHSAAKIIGGLKDGKIVIWDITSCEPNRISILPSLKSSLLESLRASTKSASKLIFIHHTSEIVFLDTISSDNSNPSIITISRDGVLNVWSTNYLASPRLSSIRLCVPSKLVFLQTKYVDPMPVEKAILLESNAMNTSKITDNHMPEFRFLDRVVVGTSSGKMYKLTNSKVDGFIDTNYEIEINKFDTFVANKLSSIIELRHKNELFIVTSHYNWTLQVWRLSVSTPLITIPTSSLIIDSCSRPHHPLQFVTVGTIKESKVLPVVLFWDMSKRTMSPLFEISLPVEDITYANQIKFNPDGNKLLIGLNDGSVVVWDIDDNALAEYSSDDTLESFIDK